MDSNVAVQLSLELRLVPHSASRVVSSPLHGAQQSLPKSLSKLSYIHAIYEIVGHDCGQSVRCSEPHRDHSPRNYEWELVAAITLNAI